MISLDRISSSWKNMDKEVFKLLIPNIKEAVSNIDGLRGKIQTLNYAGLTNEQIQAALSTEELKKEIIQQEIAAMGLTVSLDKLTISQRVNALNLTEEQKALVAKSGLLEVTNVLSEKEIKLKLESAIASGKITGAERDQIATLLSLNAAQGSSVGFMNLMTGAITKLKAAFLGLSIAMKGLVIGLAIFTAFKIGQTIFNSVNTSFEELSEKASESASALQEVQQELSNLESQLEDVKSQINDFDGKTLTLVEEQELSKLRDTQSYLENMIALQKQNESVQAKTAMEDAYNALTQEARDDFTFGAFFTGTYDGELKSSLDKAEEKLANIKKLQDDIDKDKKQLEELDIKNLSPTNSDDVLKYEKANAIKVAIEQNEKMLEEAKNELITLQAENAEFANAIQENNYDEFGNIIYDNYNESLLRYNKINTELRILNENASQVIQEMVSDLANLEGYSVGKSAAQGLLNLSAEDLKNPQLVDDIDAYVAEIQKQLNAKGYEFTVEDIKLAFNIDNVQTVNDAKKQIEDNLESAGLFKNFKVDLNESNFSNIGGFATIAAIDEKGIDTYKKNIELISEFKNIVLNADNDQLAVLRNADWTDQSYQNFAKNFSKIKDLYSDVVEYMMTPNDPDFDTSKLSRSDTLNALIKRGEEVGISVQDWMEKYTNGILTLGDVVRDELIEITEELQSNLEEFLSSTTSVTDEAAKEIAQSFSDMWSDEDWREANSDMVDLAKQSIVTAEDVEELAKTDDKLASILDKQGMSAQYAANCLNQIGAGGSVFDIITSDALTLNATLNELAGAFEAVATARSEYEAKMEKEDYNGDFQSYASAYDDIMTDFEKGEYGQKFWARAEYLLGDKSWTMTVDEVYKAVSKLDGVFDDVESNGLGMLTKLSKIDFKKLGLESYVTKLSNGNYKWDIKADELEKLAKAAGMSTEAFTACLKALGMYEGTQFYDVEKLSESLKGMNIALKDTEGNAVISKQALMEMFTNLGYTGKEAMDLLTQIEKMSGIKLIDFDVNKEGMDSFLAELSKLEEFADYDFSSKEVNISDFINDLHNTLGMSGTDIATFVDTMEQAGYKFVDASGKTVESIDAVNMALRAGKPSEYAKSVEEATTQLNELKSAVDELPDGEEKLKLEADIEEYERQINEASEATGWVPEEVVTKLTFEVDKAEIIKKIEEAKKAAQWAASDEQRKEYQAQQLTGLSEYVDVNKNQMNMGSDRWEKSSFGKVEQIAVQLNVDGNQDEALKAMEKLRSETDWFISQNPEINFETDPKGAEKAVANYEKIMQEVTGITITPDMSTEELNEYYNQYEIMASACEELGVKINWGRPEIAIEQIQGIIAAYNSAASILESKGLTVDVNTEEGREKIIELLSQLPEEISTDFTADPEKAMEVLSNYIQVAEDGTITLTLGANPQEAIAEWNRAKNKISEDSPKPKVLADTSYFTKQAIKAITEAENKEARIRIVADTSSAIKAINGLKGQTITVNVKGNVRGNAISGFGESIQVNGSAHVLGSAYASGRWGIPKAEKGSLVGELGPEIMVDPNNGVFTTVGEYGPEFVDLPKNAIIFNHLQSKSLLENGYALGRGKVVNGSAHLTGTAHSTTTSSTGTGKNTYKNISDSASGTSSSSSKSTSNKSNTTNSNTAKETASETAKEVSEILSEAFGKFFDWIEIRIDSFERKISYYEAKASNYISYTDQNKMIDNQISNLKKLIQTDQQGYSKYMAQANKVASIGRSNLSGSQRTQLDNAIKAIKNGGTINISSYSDEVQTVINEYKAWYDKAIDLNTALEENKTKLQELAATKLDNIQKYYDNRNTLRSTNISNKEAYIDYSKNKSNYSLSTSSYGNSTQYNQIRDAYSSILSDLEANAKALTEERSKLQAQLNAEVKKGNIKKYSNAWYEWQNAINALSAEIYDVKSQTQEYYRALYNLPIEKATQAIEKLGKALDLLKSKASVVAGGSNVYDRIITADAKTAMNSRKNNLDNAESKLSSSTSKLQSTLNKSKVSKSVKDRILKGIKNGTPISTSGLTGALLDAVNDYNASLSNYENASKQYETAKNDYNKAVKNQQSNSKKNNYDITNQYLDEQVANLKQQNADNQAALRAANVNVANAKADRDAKNKTLESKKNALLKYKLSASQKKAIEAGQTVSTSGLSGDALKAAQEYNKAVEASTKATNKYNAALAVQKDASANAAQSQIDYAEIMQEVAKEAFDNVVSEFDAMCSKLASDIDKLQSKLDYLEATGGTYDEQTATLKSAYDTTSEQADKQYEAIQKAQAEYDKRKDNMTDEDRLAAQSELNDMWSEYYNLLVQKKELQNQILELNNKQNFDDDIKKLDRTIDNLETERELLDDTKFDTSGNITDSGAREIEILEEAISNAEKQIGIYENKIQALNKAYEEGKLTEEEYTEQVQECEDAINDNKKAIKDYTEELKELREELALRPFDSAIKDLEEATDDLETERELLDETLVDSRGNLTEAGQNTIDSLNESIATAEKEIEIYEQKIAELDKLYAEGTITQEEYEESVRECEVAINDNKKAIKGYRNELNELEKELLLKPFESQIEDLENATEDLQDAMDLLDETLVDSKGNLTSAGSETVSALNQQIKNANEEITVYEEKLRALDQAYAEGTITEEEYRKETRACEEAINDNKKAIKDCEDALKDIQKQQLLNPYDTQLDELEEKAEELQLARDLLHTSLVDSEGNLTSAGVEEINAIADSIQNCTDEIAVYEAKMKALDQAYAEGLITEEEYNDQMRECRSAIRNNKKEIQSYKNELIDLYKEQMEKELDALNKIIDKRKQALQAMKDYYDYADSIKDQNKDIETLQAEISALEGVDDAASRSLLAQKKAQLAEAQKELDDTVRDHRYDVLSNGLDSLADDAQEAYNKAVTAIDESAEKQEEIVNQMLANISSAYDETYSEIASTVDNFNNNIAMSSQESIESINNSLNMSLEDIQNSFNLSLEDIISKLQSSTTDVQITTDDQVGIFDNALEIIETEYSETFERIKKMLEEFNKQLAEDTQNNLEQIENTANSSTSGSNSSTTSASISNEVSSINGTSSDTLQEKIQDFLSTLSKTTLTEEQLNKANDLVSYIGINYGKSLSLDDILRLGKLLGVSDLPSNYEEITSANKTAILNAFKKAGFSRGGIVDSSFTPLNSIFDVIKRNGDDSLVIGAKSGESIMTEQFTKMLPTLLKNIDLFNGVFDNIKDMNFSLNAIPQKNGFEIHFDNLINIQGNVDKDVMNELKEYSEKIYQEVTQRITQYLTKELRKIR